MIVSYRCEATQGTKMFTKLDDLSIAFNRVAAELQTDKLLAGDIGKQVRIEGTVKIDRKKYRAIIQGGLVVIAGAPAIPDRIEVKC